MNHHPIVHAALAADRQRELRAAGRAARSRAPDRPAADCGCTPRVSLPRPRLQRA